MIIPSGTNVATKIVSVVVQDELLGGSSEDGGERAAFLITPGMTMGRTLRSRNLVQPESDV